MSNALDAALIGAVIAGERFPVIVPDARDFTTKEGGETWTVMQRLHATGAPINFGSVYTALTEDGRNDLSLWLNDIMSSTQDTNNAEWYARQVIDRGASRNLRRQLLDIAADESLSFRNAVERIEETVSGLSKDEWRGWKELSAYIEQQATLMQDGVPSGIYTGFSRLDNSLIGLRPGHVYLLAGRPSNGKTTLALQFSLNIIKAGIPVLYFLLETSGEMMALKTIALELGIESDKLLHNRLDSSGWVMLSTLVDDKMGKSLYLDTSTDLSVTNFRSRVMSARENLHIGMIVVDYLQLMNAPGHSEREKVNNISRTLTRVAKDAGVPILALSQLSRLAEYERPSLHHMKESGNLESDADVAMLVYRHRSKMDAELDKRASAIDAIDGRGFPIELSWLEVAKNRYAGKLDTIALRFNRLNGSFSEVPNG